MTLAKAEENLETKNPLPQGWRWIRLGDICDMNPSRPAGFRRASDTLTTFVPMSAVDEHRGVILNIERRPFREVAKGYTFFGEGDILFAKITPCMQNGKQAIARGLIDGIGFGSTEFHVIRPRPGVASEWIHRFVRQPHVLSASANHFTGAVGQQRVPESFLASLEIPLPPIDEQDRIMHIVNEQMAAIEKARAAAEARLEAAKALPKAYLRAVFESEEAKGWPLKRLGDIAAKGPDNGIFKHRSDFGEGVPIINVSDLYESLTVVLSLTEHVKVTNEELKRYGVAEGDLFFCRSSLKREGVGWCCYLKNLPEPAVFDCHVMRVHLDSSEVLPEYAAYYWQLPKVREMVIGNSRTSTMTTMNQDDLAAIPIPVAPLHEQSCVVAHLNECFDIAARLRKALKVQLETLETLPATLLRRAFTGGL